ncbi:hypothetical protein [Sorangium sp. So ce1099]|uniref:hypothetical protein n=1 Tax=Sorangium sp. So ce1099 TaxID=3133331 RepID=UPI003F60BAAC
MSSSPSIACAGGATPRSAAAVRVNVANESGPSSVRPFAIFPGARARTGTERS